MEFFRALEKVYFYDPCGVLLVPFWKAESTLQGVFSSCRVSGEGSVDHLEAWDESGLQVYWDRTGEWRPDAPEEFWKSPKFAVVHSQYAAHFPRSSHYSIQRYFRLQLGESFPVYSLPDGFTFAPVQVPVEIPLAAEVIGRCYPHLHPSCDEVLRWTRQPVFTPELWVWVVDRLTSQPAGLGIADFDPVRREASLEWIQVIPEYRGRGVARALISYLLSSLNGRARLVTVSGGADNPSDAEHIYRRCGFVGNHIWWVIRKLGE